MAERKKGRAVHRVNAATESHPVEITTGKQPKFVLELGNLEVDHGQVEELRSEILRSSIQLLKSRRLGAATGGAPRPRAEAAMFSVTFASSFSLGG